MAYTDTLLTTVDNPWNPFTQWDEWLGYDRTNGHYTCELLARYVMTGDTIEDLGTYYAMTDVVLYDPFEKYIMVTEKSFDALFNAGLIGKSS